MIIKRDDEPYKCSYCHKPIKFVKLNKKIAAGACRTERCVYVDRVHIYAAKSISSITCN